MQTIEEKAREIYLLYKEKDRVLSEGVLIGFMKGVEFAQQWISIEDELPNFDKENPFKKYVVKVIEGSITPKEFITTSHLRNQLGNWSCEMDWVRVTHWRYLEIK